MWITLEQINCLKEIAEHGSIHAASIELGKAKSAVNYSIKRLEEQLDFEVLDRSSYRTKLTPKGLAFLDKAKPLLMQAGELTETAKQIASGVEVKVALSATAIYPTQKINLVMKNILQKFKSTEFTFHKEIFSGERMLRQDQVDIAIFENLTNTLDYDAKFIGKVDLKLVISANHPFLSLTNQTFEELLNFPQIIQRSTIPDKFSIGVSKDSLKWTVSDLASKKELIYEGLGWGRLPVHEIKDELNNKKFIHLKKLKQDHSVDVHICKKKDKPFGPVLQYIWDSF
jgi:DNA-binding transcriptional LysR family regulator